MEKNVEFLTRPASDEELYGQFNELVRQWFKQKFGAFSPPQRFSIPLIRARENVLISSPTGSGKTLSAFVSILNELIDAATAGLLEDRIYAVYVSPLKALGRDIQRNLLEPLEELEALAQQRLGIRVLTRTGDTSKAERAAMARRPPHILVTTPESLAIMLTSPRFSAYFGKVEWVIVDEIHAMASSKRGTHLSLTLEHLQNRSAFCRIGLSATVAPLDEVARYLVGSDNTGQGRRCKVVDAQAVKRLDLKVLSPVGSLIRTPFHSIEEATYRLMDRLIQEHKTTLIFTNTRAATERVVHHLRMRFPRHYAVLDDDGKKPPKAEEGAEIRENAVPKSSAEAPGSLIAAHHGSLSKEHRLRIENQLKAGSLKAVVCSTSLELGIDIGYIDLVILLGSPKSVARALQRIGRSGHKLHDEAKGRILVLDRDDLVECAVLLKSAVERKIDTIAIPKGPLDVLAQQVFGFALCGPLPIDEIYRSVKRAYPYTGLSWEDFFAVVKYLAGEHVSLEDRRVYAKIWYDEATRMVGRRGKLARVLYMTNVGTIPDETNVKVRLGPYVIGTVTEPFLERLKRGDVFVLGGDAYEFQYSQGLTAVVRASAGRAPTVPSWFSEMLPLSFDLAMEIQRFRRLMSQHLQYSGKGEILKFLDEYLYVDEAGKAAILEYFDEQARFAAIPHDRQIVIEHFQDGRKHYHVFHTLFGRRVNDVLSRAVAFVLGRIHHRDVEMGITDNGFYVASTLPLQARRALRLLKASELRQLAELSLEKTEVLARRFRHCAARSLMILRQYLGRTKSVGRQQMSSRMLLAAVRRLDPGFPILREARREVLEDYMDIGHAADVVRAIEAGGIEVREVYSDVPSPFAFNLILQGYSDILKMEDRQRFLMRMHEMVLGKIALSEARGEAEPSAVTVPAGEFSYEQVWEEQERALAAMEAEAEAGKLSLQDGLMRDLDVAARRVQLDPLLKWDLARLVKGEREGFKTDVVEFIEHLLAGTVPKWWTDPLVKFLKEVLPEIK